jgi:hypothetical protein
MTSSSDPLALCRAQLGTSRSTIANRDHDMATGKHKT